jgi:hypothetical protein
MPTHTSTFLAKNKKLKINYWRKNMENKICPIIKQICNKNCAWYVKHQDLCAVILLTEDVREIAEHIEAQQNDN